MTNYKYSIVIPTRRRYQYLASAVDSALNFGEDVEVIVSVNGDEIDFNIVKLFLGFRLQIKNLFVVYTGVIVSMCQSFDFALSHSHGDYIATLGDDDAVMYCYRPLVDEHFLIHPDQPLTWYRQAYFWNDSPLNPGLCMGLPWSPPAEISIHEKLELLRTHSVSYNDLPNIYNSFFPKSHYSAIRDFNLLNFSNSSIYPHKQCIAADIYTSIQSAYLLSSSKYYLLNSPITISGISARSNGVAVQASDSPDTELNLFLSESGYNSFSDFTSKYLFKTDSVQAFNAAIQASAHSSFSHILSLPDWKPTLPWIVNLVQSYLSCEANNYPQFASQYISFLSSIDPKHQLLDYLLPYTSHSISSTKNKSTDESLMTYRDFFNLNNSPPSKPSMIDLRRYGCLNSCQSVIYYHNYYR